MKDSINDENPIVTKQEGIKYKLTRHLREYKVTLDELNSYDNLFKSRKKDQELEEHEQKFVRQMKPMWKKFGINMFISYNQLRFLRAIVNKEKEQK